MNQPVDKSITREGIRVEAGQIWKDMDRRSQGRTITITRVDSRNGLAHYQAARRGRLSIKRMYPHNAGFALVKNT